MAVYARKPGADCRRTGVMPDQPGDGWISTAMRTESAHRWISAGRGLPYLPLNLLYPDHAGAAAGYFALTSARSSASWASGCASPAIPDQWASGEGGTSRRYHSASSAPIVPVPAAVTAWR